MKIAVIRGRYPDAPKYYIRVHGHGKRRIDYTRREPNECDAPDADAAACPKVDFRAFGISVLKALQAKLGDRRAGFIGAGACGDTSGPLERWSIRVWDFRDADEALRIIDAELHRWDVADDWGLSIEGVECYVLEASEVSAI